MLADDVKNTELPTALQGRLPAPSITDGTRATIERTCREATLLGTDNVEENVGHDMLQRNESKISEKLAKLHTPPAVSDWGEGKKSHRQYCKGESLKKKNLVRA